MTTAILKISGENTGRTAVSRALSEAGVGVVEIPDWDAASEALRGCGAALVVHDGELLDSHDASNLAKAITALASDRKDSATELPQDVLRKLSHDLRTPLSAMSGWLYLLESGKLDEAGMKRAIEKLRGNIDDQVRTLERYLGTNTAQPEGTSPI